MIRFILSLANLEMTEENAQIVKELLKKLNNKIKQNIFKIIIDIKWTR